MVMKYFISAVLAISLGLSSAPAFAATKSAPLKKAAIVKKIAPLKKTTIQKVTTIKKTIVKKVTPVKKVKLIIPVSTYKPTPSYDKPVEDYLNTHSGIENPLLTPHYNLPSGIY